MYLSDHSLQQQRKEALEAFRRFMNHYVPLNTLEWLIIKRYATFVRFKKGSYMFHQGDVCDHMYFVTKGLGRAYFINETNGKDYTATFVFNDPSCHPTTRVAVDYDSFLHRVPAKFSLEVLEDIDAIEIKYDVKNWLFEHSLTFQKFARILTEESYCRLQEILISTYIDDTQTRYNNFLKYFHDIVDRIPQYYIASYLNITPQHMSRLKKSKVL